MRDERIALAAMWLIIGFGVGALTVALVNHEPVVVRASKPPFEVEQVCRVHVERGVFANFLTLAPTVERGDIWCEIVN